MSAFEEEALNTLIASNPGLEATPELILQFIAARAGASGSSPPRAGRSSPDEEEQEPGRGRLADRDGADGWSRSSSRESAFYGRQDTGSRPPSRGPQTPSAFDKRQRSAPLGVVAPPSSWSKPPPAARRKSVDGGRGSALSDSEVRRVL